MKQFAVIGLGRFGAAVVNTLAKKRQQVIAIDKSEELVHDVMDLATKAVCLDAEDEKAVKAVGLEDVDVAICAIGTNIEASILITLILKDLGIKEIVCKATTEAHKKVLEKIGATRVILPERDMGNRIADTLISQSETILDHIGLSADSSIIDFLVPDDFVGKTLRDLSIRARFGVNVIAIKKIKKTARDGEEVEEESINAAPQADDIITKGDILVVFGANDKIDKMKHGG